MYKLNILFVGEGLHSRDFDRQSFSILASTIEEAIEKIQSIDFEMVVVDSSIGEEEVLPLKSLLERLHPETRLERVNLKNKEAVEALVTHLKRGGKRPTTLEEIPSVTCGLKK